MPPFSIQLIDTYERKLMRFFTRIIVGLYHILVILSMLPPGTRLTPIALGVFSKKAILAKKTRGGGPEKIKTNQGAKEARRWTERAGWDSGGFG